MSKLLNKLNDLSKITRRAAFSDMEHQIKKYKYGSDAFMQILESRYSCHAFTHHPVSESKLQMILDAGRMAPSAANQQPARIWVVKSEEALAKLHQVHPCYGAPVVLIVGCRNEEAWVRPYDGINAAKTDAAVVLTHLMLTATDVGLANMWIWDFNPSNSPSAIPPPAKASPRNCTTSGSPSRTWSSNCNPLKRIEVVAALIVKEGRVFATQRGYGPWKDWWEFPGGKMEPGESREDALRREIAEELSCAIVVGDLLDTVEWDYPEFHLTMHCFLCALDGAAPHLNEHEAARWLSAGSVHWLPADYGLLPKLAEHL